MNYLAERREEEKERRRETILDAAEHVFALKGFDAATMEQVARKARVSRALVYVYFKDKTALQLGVCIRGLKILRQAFESARQAHATGYEQVKAIGRAYMQFSEDRPTHFAAMSRFEATPADFACAQEDGMTQDMMLAGQQVHEQTVLAILKGMADKTLRGDIDDPMRVSITLWAFSHGTIQLAQTKGPFIEGMGISKANFLEEALDLAMQSLINRNTGVSHES